MRTKTQITGLLMAAAMLMALPVLAFAEGGAEGQGAEHEPGMRHGHGEEMMAKILGLSEDQAKQFKDLHQKQKESMKASFEQMKTNREALETEIAKATPDMAKITDLQNQIKAIQGQIIDDHLNTILAVKKILTPEQFSGYMALKKEREMKMHRMGHDREGFEGKHEGDKDKEHEDQD